MERLKNYLRSDVRSRAADALLPEEVPAVYDWFTVARAVRAKAADSADALSATLQCSRAVSSLYLKAIDAERLAAVTEGELIDRFLLMDDYRIVADEEGEADDICTTAHLDEADDLVSEELAEVYAAQGMNAEAIEIYRKLSLLNTEKSIYFAEKIEKLTNNN
ncbi:MAG: hypothetical protein ACI35T_02105 [Alistipes sp.]